jgi:hypothetical protein
MRPVTVDMNESDRRPCFLWDEDVSIGELRAVLAGPSGPERDRLLGKLLREARDLDVRAFLTLGDVAEALPRVEQRVGRRAPF